MNIYELQSYFINELTTGHPEDFLIVMDQSEIYEEFSRLLFTWYENKNDPVKLQSAMSNEIAAMVCRVTETIDTDEIDLSDMHAEDAAYQRRKDGF